MVSIIYVADYFLLIFATDNNRTRIKSFINCYQLIKIASVKKILSPGRLIIIEFCFMRTRNKKRANPLLPALFLVNICSSDYCYATRSYIPSDLLWDLFLHLFPITVTLSFILLHLNGDTTVRLVGLHYYSGLSFFWCHKLAKKDVKSKMFRLLCFCCYFVDDCIYIM